MGIQNWLVEIHNSIMNVHNSFMDLHNCDLPFMILSPLALHGPLTNCIDQDQVITVTSRECLRSSATRAFIQQFVRLDYHHIYINIRISGPFWRELTNMRKIYPYYYIIGSV